MFHRQIWHTDNLVVFIVKLLGNTASHTTFATIENDKGSGVVKTTMETQWSINWSETESPWQIIGRSHGLENLFNKSNHISVKHKTFIANI